MATGFAVLARKHAPGGHSSRLCSKRIRRPR
ncbi:UNVERIFIED_ORG: hypothetical protein J2740_004570 [Rhizobium nepotum]|nr:hypothetical protein [Rhizobium nepotum]